IVPRVERIPGIAGAAPIQVVPHAITADSSMLAFGADLHSFLARRLVLTSGRFAQGSEVMVGAGAASQLHVHAGQRLLVEGHQLTIAGIYRSGISLEDRGI